MTAFARSRWLALAFFLSPAPARSGLAACKSDIMLYCQSASKETQEDCLVDNWHHVSLACRTAVADSSKNPCREVIRAHCLDIGPNIYLGACINEHLSQASPACRKQVETNPCAVPLSQYCKAARPGKDALNCLMNRLEAISNDCLTSLQDSPYWTRPCREEMERFCRDAPPGPAQDRCLWANLDKLSSPICRRLVGRMHETQACDDDAAALCKNAPPEQLPTCLLNKSSKLSKPCLQKLRRNPMQ